MFMKRNIALIAAPALVLSLFAGCGGTAAEPAESVASEEASIQTEESVQGPEESPEATMETVAESVEEMASVEEPEPITIEYPFAETAQFSVFCPADSMA